jgi:hypothetical protein
MPQRLTGPDAKIFAACAALIALALAWPAPAPRDPGLRLAGGFLTSTCILRTVTGVECPFCGLSRSLVALAHGRPAQAAAFHPLGPATALLLLMQLFYRGARLLFARGLPDPARASAAFRLAPLYVLAAAFILVWAGRIVMAAARYL